MDFRTSLSQATIKARDIVALNPVCNRCLISLCLVQANTLESIQKTTISHYSLMFILVVLLDMTDTGLVWQVESTLL